MVKKIFHLRHVLAKYGQNNFFNSKICSSYFYPLKIGPYFIFYETAYGQSCPFLLYWTWQPWHLQTFLQWGGAKNLKLRENTIICVFSCIIDYYWCLWYINRCLWLYYGKFDVGKSTILYDLMYEMSQGAVGHICYLTYCIQHVVCLESTLYDTKWL